MADCTANSIRNRRHARHLPDGLETDFISMHAFNIEKIGAFQKKVIAWQMPIRKWTKHILSKMPVSERPILSCFGDLQRADCYWVMTHATSFSIKRSVARGSRSDKWATTATLCGEIWIRRSVFLYSMRNAHVGCKIDCRYYKRCHINSSLYLLLKRSVYIWLHHSYLPMWIDKPNYKLLRFRINYSSKIKIMPNKPF